MGTEPNVSESYNISIFDISDVELLGYNNGRRIKIFSAITKYATYKYSRVDLKICDVQYVRETHRSIPGVGNLRP
jgi:hypothetical protein